MAYPYFGGSHPVETYFPTPPVEIPPPPPAPPAILVDNAPERSIVVFSEPVHLHVENEVPSYVPQYQGYQPSAALNQGSSYASPSFSSANQAQVSKSSIFNYLLIHWQ